MPNHILKNLVPNHIRKNPGGNYLILYFFVAPLKNIDFAPFREIPESLKGFSYTVANLRIFRPERLTI
jgi:hypothetical protein